MRLLSNNSCRLVSQAVQRLFQKTSDSVSEPKPWEWQSNGGERHEELDQEKKSLWLWHEGSAPVGRLLSLLACEMAALGDIESMCWLWRDFVRALRVCWDTHEHLPFMSPYARVDGRAPSEVETLQRESSLEQALRSELQ
ncbi:unnamed protein product, partial [Chrysoparadoxa australica]